MEGWRKEDLPTKKKLPVGIDAPDFLSELRMEKYATEMVKAVVDCTIIEFYYLLRVGEYTVKKQGNETKQMVQFKLGDTMFFRQDSKGHLRQLPRNALDKDILSADGVTLKLDHLKMDGKECVFTKNTMEMKSSAR